MAAFSEVSPIDFIMYILLQYCLIGQWGQAYKIQDKALYKEKCVAFM